MADERVNIKPVCRSEEMESALRQTRFRVDVTELLTQDKHSDLTDLEAIAALQHLTRHWTSMLVEKELRNASTDGGRA